MLYKTEKQIRIKTIVFSERAQAGMPYKYVVSITTSDKWLSTNTQYSQLKCTLPSGTEYIIQNVLVYRKYNDTAVQLLAENILFLQPPDFNNDIPKLMRWLREQGKEQPTDTAEDKLICETYRDMLEIIRNETYKK